MPSRIRVLISSAFSLTAAYGLSKPHRQLERRDVFASLAAGAAASFPLSPALATEDEAEAIDYRTRSRKGNKNAIIRDDYWFISGKTPPRLLAGPIKGDDPQFNAFGSCTTDGENNNSCTYVSLKQRSAAYNKYASSIAAGAQQFGTLQALLQSSSWSQAETLLRTPNAAPPPPPVDAELKMVLLATALLTSPNFPLPSTELLVARYYVNEVHFSHQEILAAIEERDQRRALAAWEYGKDAWNSYFASIDRQIVVEKVGDKFVGVS